MSTHVQANEFRCIPLKQLVLSPLNVRKTGTETGIEELAALIEAQTVLQNLTVYEEPKKSKKRGIVFAVVAGGRRWRALQWLLKHKRIEPDYTVPCRVVSFEHAQEISIAENSGRAELHIADQFEAFKALIDAGRSIEDIAARFGVMPVVVQRRLKLANVAPELIQAYRQGDTTLECLTAFAISDDHAKQQGDSEPYLRWTWLLGWMAICPRHQAVMIDRCQKCHTKLRVLQFSSLTPFSPSRCTRCEEPLLVIKDLPAHSLAIRLQASLLQAKKEGATTLPGLGRFTWPELVSFIDVITGMTVTDTIGEELQGILLRYQAEMRDVPFGRDTSLSARYGSLLLLAWMIEGWPDSTGAEVGRDMLARWASGKRNRISRHLGAKWADPWSPGPNDIPPEIKRRLCQLLP